MPWKPSKLSEIEWRVWGLIEKAPAPGRHAARNALFHIERAYAIHEIDPEMAFFRSITAEEEAVRAIFDALQRRDYPNASTLNWRDHKQKAAVVPFLRAVADLIGKAGFAEPTLAFEKKDGEDVLRVRIRIPDPRGIGFLWLVPEPPLDFNLDIDDKRHDFHPEIQELLASAKVVEFATFVKDRANERNRLLYATTQGIPKVDGNIKGVLEVARGRVMAELAVYLLIDTVKTRQQFVTQCLDAFLRLMDLIPDGAAA